MSAELSRVEKKHNFVIIFTPIYNTLIFTEILTQLKVWTAEILQQPLTTSAATAGAGAGAAATAMLVGN